MGRRGGYRQLELEEKKTEVKGLYTKVDKITEGVNEYKSISEKAINKHDEAIARHANWWDSLTTNITYQGKFNQQILENILTGANLVKNRDFFAQKKQTTYDIDEDKDKDVIPDILLKFPERNYIIDAKVSLADWTKYVEAVKSNKEEDKKLADNYLKDHIDSVRKHLFGPKGLDKKNYNKLYGINSLKQQHCPLTHPLHQYDDPRQHRDCYKRQDYYSIKTATSTLI